MSLFDELKRRNVFRTGIAYLALSWLIIQIAETLLPVYGFTDAAIRNLVAILVVGLAPVLILSWTFEWLDIMVDMVGPDMLELIDTDYYEKMKSDPRWRTLRDKCGYFDEPVGKIEIEVTLPPGVSVD